MPALVDILTRFCYTPALGKPHPRMRLGPQFQQWI
jgi:hypothetical protein